MTIDKDITILLPYSNSNILPNLLKKNAKKKKKTVFTMLD